MRVLVVEDQHIQAEALTMLLTLEGFEVAVAFDGKDALSQLDSVRPDVIITDCMMPVMSGGEMAKLVRASTEYATVPIVMTSATDSRALAHHREHCDAFLRKPYLWDDLLVVIKRLLSPSIK